MTAADAVALAIAAAERDIRLSWFEKLPKQAQQELLEVRRRWQDGQYGAAAFSVIHRGVSERMKKAGWQAPCCSTLIAWLRQSSSS